MNSGRKKILSPYGIVTFYCLWQPASQLPFLSLTRLKGSASSHGVTSSFVVEWREEESNIFNELQALLTCHLQVVGKQEHVQSDQGQ
jgi:hypothetical protein